MTRKLGNQKGFTLVELVIVITILAILSALGVQSYGQYITKAKAQADIESANMIAEALIKGLADQNINDADATSIDGTDETNLMRTGSVANAEPIATANLVNLKYLEAIPQPKTFKNNGGWYYRLDNATGRVRVFLQGDNDGSSTKHIMLYPKKISAWQDAPFNSVK